MHPRIAGIFELGESCPQIGSSYSSDSVSIARTVYSFVIACNGERETSIPIIKLIIRNIDWLIGVA